MVIAAIITASATLLATLLAGIVAIIREVRAGRRETKAEVASVHTIVNQQRTDMLKEIRQLKKALRAQGVNPD